MSELSEPDGWTGVEVSMEIGAWDHEGAPHGQPWPGTTRIPISSVWADEARTLIVAVEDSDGCRAPVVRQLRRVLRRVPR